MIKFALLLIALQVTSVYCDLPVHCLKHQIVGKWKLHIQAASINGFGQLSCGHSIPDNERTSYTAGQKDFKQDYENDLILDSEYNVKRIGEDRAVGSWTMVYDEGFEISYKNTKYFAFSKYDTNKTSYCDQTLVGWYRNEENGERGCYRAEKQEKVEQTESLDQISVVQPGYMDEKSKSQLGMIQLSEKTNVLQNCYLCFFSKIIKSNKPSTLEDHQKIVDEINSSGMKWEAKVYDHMIGKSFLELNSNSGRKKYYQGPRKVQAVSFAQTSTSTRDDSGLPDNFDYRELLKAPVQQESCGSCYAIATMAMLSARLRKAGEDVTLSAQHSLNCNYYNQGCDGGYPFLVSKWAQEEYLVPEDVVPYTARDGACDDHIADNFSKVYAVKSYRYIGGAYGKTNEKDIMNEIYHNGPVVMNFEPTMEFMYYSKGVYHSKDSDWVSKPEWEKVDHSVLCYGWGVDNGEKFWVLQNSWGSDWGENGNFRIRRGTDESAIESMAEAADPKVIQKSGSSTKQKSTQKDNQFNSFVQQKQNLRKTD